MGSLAENGVDRALKTALHERVVFKVEDLLATFEGT